MARSAKVVLALLTLLVLASPGWSAIITLTPEFTLQDVMAMPNGLLVYDKVFSSFSYTTNVYNGGIAPSADAVKVQGVWIDSDTAGIQGQHDDADEYGLRFTGGWSAIRSQISDTVIRFKLAVDNPRYMITDNTLWMSSGAAANNGLAAITESVYSSPQPTAPIGVKYVYYIDPETNRLLHHIEYPEPVSEVWIVKDVLVNGGGSNGGSATISEFYQTFSQKDFAPEPTSIALIALGGLIMLGRRKRRA